MKYILLVLTLISGWFLSCENETPMLEIDYHSREIYFTAQALENERVTINVNTNQHYWDVVSSASWCIVTKYDNYFVISATPQTSSEIRPRADVTITAGYAPPIIIEVYQEQVFLNCTPMSDWSFSDEGGKRVLSILCNSSWSITTNQEWVLFDKNNGCGYEDVEVEILSSNEDKITEATLEVTSCGITCRINITRDKKRKVYKIGDYYPDAQNPIGVVFHTTDNGKCGLLVYPKSLYGGCYSTEYYLIGANSADGQKNMKKMEERGLYLYPAARYCRSIGENWYIPSISELVTLYENNDIVNENLIAMGGDKLSSGSMSSTECSLHQYLKYNPTSSTPLVKLDKNVSSYFRAISAF